MPPTPKLAPVTAVSEKAERTTPVRWHWASALAGALIAAILLGSVTFLWRRPTPSPITLHAPPTPSIPTPEPTPTAAPLVVFVSGAVQTPGLYALPAGARVADALAQAGGFAPDANTIAINQAMLLADGDQLHVPTLVEEPATPQGGLSRSASPVAPGVVVGAAGGLVNINSATQAELETLPGIGPARAQAIIDNRPYKTVEDLDRVPGIGAATLEDVRPFVVVD